MSYLIISFEKLDFLFQSQLLSNNQSALHMIEKQIYHVHSQYIKFDHHFIREKITIRVLITTQKVLFDSL